ncbi:YheC/YheD family protein [Neobacillus niacini]|uniref:YheC/YheD family protein n=1 Tax=Neobacillus niacini TaxID=86668 RepID=UPI003B01B27D
MIKLRVINEKFSQYSHLITDEKIAPHIPETALLSKSTFYEYINKYYQVYLRPCHNYKISILVTSLEDQQFRIESGCINEIIQGTHKVYQFIENNLLNGKRFIIQQAFPRLTIDENHFDIRVYAVKTSSKWMITEKIARITPDGYSITEEVKGVFPLSSVRPESSFNSIFQGACTQLDDIALLIAIKLEEKYPTCKFVIIDFILDLLGKPWMNEIRFRFSDGKWDWYQVLRGEQGLFPYLPETYPYHEKVLLSYLEEYKNCMIKPNISQWGIGIAVITQLENQSFEIHSERSKIPITDFHALLEKVHERYISKKAYHIQEKIPLATVKDCPFDVRVMVQRKNVNSDWVVTGKITRTAAKGYIVTNVAKSLSTVEDAIEASKIDLKNIDSLLWEIDQLGILVARQLEKVYPDSCLWGMDIGIDQEGKPWFIEANLVPDVSIFRYLPDKTMLNTIKEYLREAKKKSDNQ